MSESSKMNRIDMSKSVQIPRSQALSAVSVLIENDAVDLAPMLFAYGNPTRKGK